MTTTTHRTEYGTATITPNCAYVEADNAQLYAWANRTGAVWPCSDLEELDSIRAGFDDNGLFELTDDVDGDELNAWSSDVLRDVLPADHPAHFVAVGQFPA